MTTFEILFYIVLIIIGNIIFINLIRKIILYSIDKKHHSTNSNDIFFYGSTSTLTQSSTNDNDCNDSSFFDAGCDSGGGDGGD